MGICASERPKTNNGEDSDESAVEPAVDVDEPVPVEIPPELESVIPHRNRVPDFYTIYEVTKTLGEGSTCGVFQMEEITTGTAFAVKRMQRSAKSTLRGFRREAVILGKLNHNHVVALHGLYADLEYYWIAQELCTGGMVLEHVRKRKQFTEEDAIEILDQILRAIAFLHAHNIVHRDIKPDNIVYQSNRRNRIVLIDFGQAREIDDQQEFTDWVGTPAYMAPEVTVARTGADLKKVDMWAVGVTTFVLLTGYLPFFGHNVKELMKEICQKKLTFPKSVPLSTDARKFVAALLRRNIKKRLSAEESLQDHWISVPAPTTRANLKVWTDNVASYSNSTSLKKMVVDMVRQEMSEEEMEVVREAFRLMDVNDDGSIQEEEIAEFLRGRQITGARADLKSRLAAEAMRNDENKIDFDSFSASAVTAQLGTDEDLIRAMFNKLDDNGDGMITPAEIQKAKTEIFGEDVTIDECEQMIGEIDRNDAGYVTFHSFSAAMVHLTQRGQRPAGLDELKEDMES